MSSQLHAQHRELRGSRHALRPHNVVISQLSLSVLRPARRWEKRGCAHHCSAAFLCQLLGDPIFNGVASDVLRTSFVNGIHADGSYRLNPQHTLRGGFYASGETTEVRTVDLLQPLDASDAPTAASPYTVVDSTPKLGWLLGLYLQEEWKITKQLTLNMGIRFDQMYQFVDANQFSPRASLIYEPLAGTTIHAGYARYFTLLDQFDELHNR